MTLCQVRSGGELDLLLSRLLLSPFPVRINIPDIVVEYAINSSSGETSRAVNARETARGDEERTGPVLRITCPAKGTH